MMGCTAFLPVYVQGVMGQPVLVGGTATQSILGDTRGITRLRGQVFRYKNDYMNADVPVHVIYHPSYLLRQPTAKKQCWADLLALKSAILCTSRTQ